MALCLATWWGERHDALDVWHQVSKERRERTPQQQADAIARARTRMGPNTRRRMAGD
jgi:hypothetical protein